MRGNLETRLAKLDGSDWDGIILAMAGLVRLGLEDRITEVLTFEKVLPAVGQGALAIEVREDDRDTLKYVKSLASEPTTISTTAERALLCYLEGGCQIPIGTWGRIENNKLILDAMIGSLDGRKAVRGRIQGSPEEAEALGTRLAQTLLDAGGKEILDRIRESAPVESPVV